MAKVAAAGLDWDTALTYWQTVVRLLARDGDGYWRLARCAGQMMVMLNVAVGGAARALLGQERVTEVAAWLYPGQQAGLGVAVGWAHLAAGLQLTEEGQHAAAAVQYEAASKYAEDRGGPAEALHRHAQALHHQLDGGDCWRSDQDCPSQNPPDRQPCRCPHFGVVPQWHGEWPFDQHLRRMLWSERW